MQTERGLRVAMFTPWRARCGISDYSRLLIEALHQLPDIASLHVVESPDEVDSLGGIQAVRRFRVENRRYQALGAQMQTDQADLAHVQHQYFFFGGVAPHKNHAPAFLEAVRIPVVLTVHEIARPPLGANWLVRQAVARTNRSNFLHPAICALIVHTQRDREELLALGADAQRVHVVTHPTPLAAPMPEGTVAKQYLHSRKYGPVRVGTGERGGDQKEFTGLNGNELYGNGWKQEELSSEGREGKGWEDKGWEGKRVVTLFGFLAAKKGHTLALEALATLPSDVVLVFAGGQHPQDRSDYVADLRSRIVQANLETRVLITDYLEPDEIPIVMAATDVAIAPFLHSSGSGSLANLFAYGRAVIASDIPPHREIAAEMPEGLELFPNGDAAALAAHIEAVLTDNRCRERLQKAARTYAENHSYLTMARQTVEIYRSLL